VLSGDGGIPIFFLLRYGLLFRKFSMLAPLALPSAIVIIVYALVVLPARGRPSRARTANLGQRNRGSEEPCFLEERLQL